MAHHIEGVPYRTGPPHRIIASYSAAADMLSPGAAASRRRGPRNILSAPARRSADVLAQRGLAENHAGEERAERKRNAKELGGAECNAERDRWDGETEQLA
jgi:hypothetical protein